MSYFFHDCLEVPGTFCARFGHISRMGGLDMGEDLVVCESGRLRF